ncbi:MAG: SRPBCC domain-containing protein, partial [Acidimicrobiia bacterium]|nr:SRPBCC domain-containing protein [Acidimicrobiia bacterium]
MNDENSVMIERTLDAPVELVWQMWTDADHFAAWYGPMGATIPKAEMDVRVGGRRLICMAMETPNGPMQMWFTGEYREVVPNQRLVYTEAMSDENGNVQSGGQDGHPESTDVIVELEDLGGKTRMVMTHVGIPADSPGAAGWSMALDSLATHVASQV